MNDMSPQRWEPEEPRPKFVICVSNEPAGGLRATLYCSRSGEQIGNIEIHDTEHTPAVVASMLHSAIQRDKYLHGSNVVDLKDLDDLLRDIEGRI